MLRSEFPFKISLASSPTTLIEPFLQFFGHSNTSLTNAPPVYEKKMDINGISVRLHIKHLLLKNQVTDSRLREFQGSIAMIYIFEKEDKSSFEEVKSDFDTFNQLYKTVEIQPVFLGIGTTQESEVTSKIIQALSESDISYNEFIALQNENFTQFIRSIIANSKSFIATTQGSCDVNLE